MPVPAGLQPVHGSRSSQPSGFPKGVKMGEQVGQAQASDPGLKQLAEMRVLPLAVKHFYFFMNFAALAGTEIARKLLLPLRLPGWLCQSAPRSTALPPAPPWQAVLGVCAIKKMSLDVPQERLHTLCLAFPFFPG